MTSAGHRSASLRHGTGLGLAGIAAGLAGAAEVVLTDREPRALYCALCAAAANGLAVAPLPREIAAAEVRPRFFRLIRMTAVHSC